MKLNNLSYLYERSNLESFNSEKKDYIPDFNYLNINSFLVNKNKIEESNNTEDHYYFLPKTPKLDINNNKNILVEKQTKENSNQENKIPNELDATKNKEESQYTLYNINSSIQDVDYGKIQNLKNNLVFKSHLGRKRRDENSEREHDRFSDDNLRRKVKNVMLNKILDFINERIYFIYGGKIGMGPRRKELLSVNQANKYNITVEIDKKYIYKTLGEIFSEEISPKYTSYLPSHNKLIIEHLINEEDENKRLYFKKLFDIQFIQCVESFCGTKYYEELKDMKKFKDIKCLFGNDQKYIDILEYYFKNFEDIIKNKKGRKKRTKSEKTTRKNNGERINIKFKIHNEE